MYKDVYSDEGVFLKRKIRTTEAEFKELQDDPAYSNYGAWEDRKKMARFIDSTYRDFFVDNGATKSVANRVATMGEKYVDGERVFEEISNLDLHNQSMRQRRNKAFYYESGWFPKVPKLLEEYGSIFSKAYLQEW